MSLGSKMSRWLKASVAMIYGFVLFAPVIVIYYSFSPTVMLEVPPSGLTLRWYANLFDHSRLVNGIGASIAIAALATTIAVALGVPAAYALTRSRRVVLSSVFLSPLILPGIVLALGLLMAMSIATPSLVGSMWPLIGAHVLVTLPWVIRTVSANLEIADPHLDEAARGLGASPIQTFFLVTLPSIRPGIVTGAIFAFIVSFGNFALSLFFASGRLTTLPVAIFEYIDQFQDPTVAAASSLVILATTLLVVAGTHAKKMELP
jgi:putative spermidine/putrescine transport system permease protein